jgi:predicted DNA-binding protein with PD1-like motif
VFVVNVHKGQEVLDTIGREVKDRGVTDAAIVSLIGATEGTTVSVMAYNDATNDMVTTYPDPLEISGTGEVHNGHVHIHIVAGGENVSVSGHLHAAHVDTFFVRAYIEPL